MLNERQNQFLLGLMHTIKTTREPFHYFLTGGAGTGKSVLIRAVYQTLQRYYCCHQKYGGPDAIKVLLMGPTGMSAFNIEGTTIHSALGLTVTQYNREMKHLTADKKNTLLHKLWFLQFMIIDEISLVGARTFLKIDHQLRQIFATDRPFGGKSVIVVGDLNQLPPVLDYPVYETIRYSTEVLAGPALWELFKCYRLDEIMRQKDDLSFANALNNLANDCLTDENKELFNSCIKPDTDNNFMRIYALNDQVNKYNQSVIYRNSNTCFVSEAIDTGPKGRTTVLDKLNRGQTYGLPKSLVLKVGIKYMMTININTCDGLVNGATGVLWEVELESNNTDIKQLWLKFDDPRVGANTKDQKRDLVPIERVSRGIKANINNQYVMVMRRQFPLEIAEAITIHKSQGQSYDNVVVNVSRKLDASRMYTAFSRARTANGLHIIGQDNIVWPQVRNNKLKDELNRLNTTAKLEFDLTVSANTLTASNNLTLFYQNLPYLRSKSNAFIADSAVTNSTFIALVECRANGHDLPGFKLAESLENGSTRPFGINFYVNNSYDTDTVCDGDVIYSPANNESHMEYLMVQIDTINTRILTVYVSPKFPKNEAIDNIVLLIKCLKLAYPKFILIGDFNMDLQTTYGQSFLNSMKLVGLSLLVPIGQSSTNSGSQLDLCFSNTTDDFAVYYDSLISDHKPINLSLNI